MKKRLFFWIGILLTLLACNFGITSPTPTTDLFATLSASTPLPGDPASTAPDPIATSVFLSTPVNSTGVPTSSSGSQPRGRIVYTCQMFGTMSTSQICIVNTDGTGFRRLTTDDTRQHYYPSLSPDGKSVVYAAFEKSKVFEIYELNLASGKATQLTNNLGSLSAPEISPDGKSIIFSRTSINATQTVIWMMGRKGADADKISRSTGWDPTWSPDGDSVLFVSDMDGAVQLFASRINGKGLHRVGNLTVGGRGDWSPDGQWIVAFGGDPGNREIYLMTADGLNAQVISPPGGNAQDPSFSPDGQWIAFTASYDRLGNANGCEIYVIRIDGSDLRRLTTNDYCDSQPRWGQ
jgi:tol-pal system beta propeller repeat protein TolB